MSDVSEIKHLIEQQGLAFKAHSERLDELAQQVDDLAIKAARPGFSAGTTAIGMTEAQRKAQDLGIRALISGNQAAADKYFAEAKGMRTSSDPDGGYLVTPTFSTDMTRLMAEVAPFIAEARTETIDGDAFEEPIDDGEAGAEWVGETQARGETDAPQIALFRCPVHEIQAEPKITQKLADTARYDVVAWLQSKVAEKFALKEVDAFFNGDGVARPTGILSLPTSTLSDASRARGTLQYVPTGANGGFHTTKADPLIDLVSELKPQFRANAKWMMNRRTLANIRKLKEAASDQYLWTPGLTAGQPDRLLGYPIIEAEQMPDMATGTFPIAFGDFRKGYTIVRRLGVRFLLDPYTQKPWLKLYTFARVGGGVNNSQAIKLLKASSS